MVCPVKNLPAELFACVLACLHMEDLCNLMRVSKAYHAIVQPALWTVIEMHSSDLHPKLALCVEEAKTRMLPRYNTDPLARGQDRNDERARLRGARFLVTCSVDPLWGEKLHKARREELAALVRRLCLSVKIESASLLALKFAHFVNLEDLEIVGLWDQNHGVEPSTVRIPALRKLKGLRLRGYLPREFVQWLLAEPEHVEELELAVLDRLVGTSNVGYWEEWVNPPPYSYVQQGFTEDLAEEDIAELTRQENLAHDGVAPRGLTCLTGDIMSRLVSLGKLHLCKPSSGFKIDDQWMHFSQVSDDAVLAEWNVLLRAIRKTLQYLVLDSQTVDPENAGSRTVKRRHTWQCANGPSYDRFVRMVLPALLEPEQCPSMTLIRLFGFEAHSEGAEGTFSYSYGRDYPNSSVDVPGQLRAAVPHAEVADYAGRRSSYWIGSGEDQICEFASNADVEVD
ncbi:hypothetical protein N0V95_007298 [Ascochyta clinopodiicola]|nr:hypothetical protein N0V95_007298 [Ascochyta clinopodiicola]